MNLPQPPDDDRTVMTPSTPGTVDEQAGQELGVDNALPIGTALGEFNITGGTGNFLDARGSGSFLGGENLDSGKGLLQVVGTISNFKKVRNISGFQQTDSLVAGTTDNFAFDAAAIASLDNSFPPAESTLGQYFLLDQSPKLLAESTVPEATSWSLLGIGLASLVAVRRRK